MSMFPNERQAAHAELAIHAARAKHELERILDCLGWPHDPALSLAIDRLIVILERPHT